MLSAWAWSAALCVILRRECQDFVIEDFGPRPSALTGRSGTVLGPHPIERADNGAAEQITGFLRLRSVMGHDAVEYDDDWRTSA